MPAVSDMNGPTSPEPTNGISDPHFSEEEDEEAQKLKMRPPDIDQVGFFISLLLLACISDFNNPINHLHFRICEIWTGESVLN
jgi:hypothetical protein